VGSLRIPDEEVVDSHGLILGGINLELHHAFAPQNCFKNVDSDIGEEYAEAEQSRYVIISGNMIWNVEQHVQVLCLQLQ
jgi:hypothetical protein